MSAGGYIIVVGYRAGAMEALARLGQPVLSICPKPLPTRFADLARDQIAVPWAEPERLVDAVCKRCGGRDVAGVLALAEASVGLSARLRAALDLPGLSTDTARIARDKVTMKAYFRERGIPVTDWLAIDEAVTADRLIDALGLPLVIKERASSGSRGLVIARDRETVTRAMRPGLMAERFVAGIEKSVESLTANGRVFWVNSSEYLKPSWATVLPHQLPTDQANGVADLNRRVLAALPDFRGMTHMEVFLTAKGAVLGEIALRPPGGHIMKLIDAAYGFDPWEAFIRLELGETPELPQSARQFAGVWLLHPGAGRVRAVHGLEAARAVPGVVHLQCKTKRGAHLKPREGTGQEAGHLMAVGSTREAVVTALNRARAAIRFEMEPKNGEQVSSP